MWNSRLTTAELEFLLGGEKQWPVQREAMGLSPELADTVRPFGASSLVARELARVDGDDLIVDDEVVSAAIRITRAADQWALASAEGNDLSLATFLTGDEGRDRTLVSAVAPGVYRIDPLRAEGDVSEQIADMVLEMAESGERVVTVGYAEVVEQVRCVDGTWSSKDAPDAPFLPITRAGLRESLIGLSVWGRSGIHGVPRDERSQGRTAELGDHR